MIIPFFLISFKYIIIVGNHKIRTEQELSYVIGDPILDAICESWGLQVCV